MNLELLYLLSEVNGRIGADYERSLKVEFIAKSREVKRDRSHYFLLGGKRCHEFTFVRWPRAAKRITTSLHLIGYTEALMIAQTTISQEKRQSEQDEVQGLCRKGMNWNLLQ